MPYAPGISYHGDQYLAQGIQSIGDNIAKVIDRRKNEATEATTLRKLAGIYDPENKDHYATMGLDDLRAAARGHALNQELQRFNTEQQFRKAQIGNWESDNARADENQALLRQQYARTSAKEQAEAGFAKDYSSGPPMVLRPDLMRQYEGESGRIRYAMSKNPGAMSHDIIGMLTRLAQQSEDPARLMTAQAKLTNAEAIANRPVKDTSKLTPYQEQSLKLRERNLNRTDRMDEIRVAQHELDNSFYPEDHPRRRELLERIDMLRKPTPQGGGNQPSGSGPSFSLDDFNDWKSKRK